MSHRNARLIFHGRRLLVERVQAGQVVAHVAKAMGVSRQCAHRWVNRFNNEGEEEIRYERDRPGERVHMDVRKLGKIPDSGGWKVHGRQMGTTGAGTRAKVGFDYVHSLVDDHSHLAYSEIHNDENGDNWAGFLPSAAQHFAAHGIATIERVMTDNPWSCRRSHAVARVLESLGATHKFIRPHCPW